MNLLLLLFGIAVVIIYLSVVIVQQGTVAVITVFGKYARVMRPGLNFKIPFIEVHLPSDFHSESLRRTGVPGHHGRSGQREF